MKALPDISFKVSRSYDITCLMTLRHIRLLRHCQTHAYKLAVWEIFFSAAKCWSKTLTFVE